jgi:ketopantoate hydroxymethyltransferase
MKLPTRSLILIVDSGGDVLRGRAAVQVGVVVHGRDVDALHQGQTVMVDLEFWSDRERAFAIASAGFKAWYAGRIVGDGRILNSSSGREEYG